MAESSAELDLRSLVPERRWIALLALTVVAGLATWAAFPPVELSGLAWVAPALLMLVLSQVPPRQGFLYGWLFGTLLMGGIVSFAAAYGALPWTLLAVVMGLFYGLFGATASALRMTQPLVRVPALAGAWFLCEFLRGHFGSLGLTFGDLAYSQSANLPLIQTASVWGHYGVSFTMALLAAAMSCMFVAMLPLTWLRPVAGAAPGRQALTRYNRNAGRIAACCFLLVIAMYIGGRMVGEMGSGRLRAATTPAAARVAVVQAEGDPAQQRRTSDAVMAEYLRLSAQQPASLIVWPETAVNGPLNILGFRRNQLRELAQKQHAHLLIGAGESDAGRTYNSAYFFRPDGSIADTYRKMDLVVFGEYVPGRDRFPFLQRYPIRDFDYTAGAGRKLFKVGDITLSPLICFEGIFPDQTRELCRLGAQVLVILTSDAWASAPGEVRGHSATAPFRAIEARKYLVRAASVGQSAIYDPYGNALAQVPCYKNGVAAEYVRPQDGLSTYHYWGDGPLVLLALVLVGWGLLHRRRGSYLLRL